MKKRKRLMLEMLLRDPDLAIPLANYIDRTGQFKQHLGEHPHTQNSNTSQDSN